MRAAVYHGRGDVRVEQVDDPAPAPDEVVLEIRAAGICGTDAHEFSHGPAMFPVRERHPVTGHLGPLIPGHEIAGTVVALGSRVDGFAVGEVVASGAGISCGTCAQCRRGRTNLCRRYATVGLQRHGALAQYCAVPGATCRSAEPYGLVGDTVALAQPMAIATHAMRRGGLAGGDHAVVIGAGGIGAFLTFAAVANGAYVTVLDLDRDRLDLADRLGAHQVVLPDPEVPVRQQIVAGEGAPAVVYEVTGRPGGLDTARALLPAGGRLVVVGLQERSVDVDLRDLTLREIDVVGTNAHVCDSDLPHALGLLAARASPWSDVAPVALALADLVDDGLAPLAGGRGTRIKTLVDPWAEATRKTRM